MYDYIVVGAGSAGCVLADRLTEDENARVLLIEAGPVDDAAEIHIPAAFSKLFQTKYDWSYLSECEPGLDGRRRYLPRGRMLGGCSSMNAMIYVRGNHRDYDAWAAGGADGWSWQDVLPYFLRAEDFTGAGRSPHPPYDNNSPTKSTVCRHQWPFIRRGFRSRPRLSRVPTQLSWPRRERKPDSVVTAG